MATSNQWVKIPKSVPAKDNSVCLGVLRVLGVSQQRPPESTAHSASARDQLESRDLDCYGAVLRKCLGDHFARDFVKR
jgi:hypothetical protein